jgi:hypothetical protein
MRCHRDAVKIVLFDYESARALYQDRRVYFERNGRRASDMPMQGGRRAKSYQLGGRCPAASTLVSV